MDKQVFDIIIVGAGTAGCLLANRLSKNSKLKVALVEAGGNDNYHWIHIPVGYLYCMGNKRTAWSKWQSFKLSKRKSFRWLFLN